MSGTDHANDVNGLEQQIERTRDELARTVEALAHKADVPARAKEKAAGVLHEAEHKAEEAKHAAGAAVIRLDETRAEKPWLLPALGAVAGLAVAGAVFAFLRRRRR